MTVIAYRDGIMAADTIAWTANSSVKVQCRPKIRRLKECGWLLGASGDTADIERFFGWMEGVADRPDFKEEDYFCALCARLGGELFLYTWKLYPFEITHPFFAIGAADQFVMGAMFAGASAEEAVRLAVAHTDGAGGDVQVEGFSR
jgi:hypothetical protein